MSKISYFSLGGQDERGRYCGVLEISGDIFILNVGIGAEFSNQLGISKIIPDFRYLVERRSRVKGVFIGCARNINISSIPYFVELFPDVPIYGGKLSLQIIESLLLKYKSEKNVKLSYRLVEAVSSSDISIGPLKVCGFKTAGSVPNSMGWIFKLPTGQNVVFIDEFLIANEGRPCCENQLHLISQQAKNRTNLLLLGAQNAGKTPGFSFPHAQNFSFLKRSIVSTNKRVLVAVYEDDWNTLLNLSKIAKIYSINYHISDPRIAKLFNGYIDSIRGGDHYLKSTALLKSDNSLIAIVGDNESLYKRLLYIHEDKHEIKFQAGDLFLIATITLPENEYEEISLLNEISKRDIMVVKQPKTILPYSAGSEDIKALVNSLCPYNLVPIDGYYKDFINVSKALEHTIDPKRIRFIGFGERIEIDEKSVNYSNTQIGKQYVNEEGIVDINHNIVLERQLLEKNGLVIVSVIYHQKKHCFSPPFVSFKAFVTDDYSRKDEIHESIVKCIGNELSKYLALHDHMDIKETKICLKDAVYKGIRNRSPKKPLILPLITKYLQ